MFQSNIGFIGAGGIASAMARGFCSATDFTGKIYLSVHRNRQKAEELERSFSGRVVICEDNQSVLENVEVVIPAVLPKQLQDVASELNFAPKHRVIHIAAGTKLKVAARWYKGAGAIVRAVPLPFAAHREGPVVLCGGDELCEQALSMLGALVKVENERELEILAAVTGVMVSYYGLVAEILNWCSSKGLGSQNALDYTCFMNEALSSLMRRECGENVASFMDENTTPGGMNELALRIIKGRGGYEPWRDALEAVGKHYEL